MTRRGIRIHLSEWTKAFRFRNRSTPAFLIALTFMVSYAGSAQTNPSFETQLKQASELFDDSRPEDAIPLLEKLVADHPFDDQVVFGLGVALVLRASKEKDPDERTAIVNRALPLLELGRKLNIEEDLLLKWNWEKLSSDLEGVRMAAIESLASLWLRHPPLVFDTAPPEGIRLPEQYRHKSSMDFEGIVYGVIWKPGGLKITYESSGISQTDAIAAMDSIGSSARYKEVVVDDHVFKLLLTPNEFVVDDHMFKPLLPPNGDWLTIAVVKMGAEGYPIGRFDCHITQKEDVEEVLSIIIGLKRLE